MSFVAVPGTRIGDYVVVSELGRGGMAVVYLAEHPKLGRKVALKLLSAKLSEDQAFRDRFIRESHVAAGIEHPNIVPVYDAGEFEGLLYMAMRYVEGTDLGKLLVREQYLSLPQTSAIVAQVAAALDAAHAKGLVHRDVKPSNVLLAPGQGPGGSDHAYLADFGLARPQIGSDLTQAGELYGTLDYMAPEQFDGRPLDARTDVYALSCITYECLTGEAPFSKESSLAKAAAHLGTRPVPPSELNPELPERVDEVVLRGLAKDKSIRFEHAGGFGAALGEIQVVEDRPPETPSSTVAPLLITDEPPTPAIPHEERKVVSVLAVMLEPDADTDPEDWRAVLDRTTPLVMREIERFGGMAMGSTGGMITGVFGAPLAHEDDAERAVRTGLRIVEELTDPTDPETGGAQPRIGVSTREALVSSGTNEDGGPITGRVVAESAGSASAASPGQVVVDANTWALTRGAIDYEELQASTPLQGGEPVTHWRAVKPISRTGNREHDHSPFVGRDAELSMLTRLFDRSRSRPATEFVTIIAEPGLGKSRLVRELARYVDRLPEFVTWREGRCLPYGDGISFWALGEIVKAQAGILETDDQATLSAKLDQVITEPDPQTRTWIKDRLAPLVGLETSTEPPQQEEAFTAWRRFLEQIAAAGPTVLVFEDLHWADEAFVAFLEHLTERTAGLPLLVVVTARPEVEERHPSWPPGRRSTVLSLSPLSDEDLESLISQSLPEADSALISIVLERAGGSPLYAEQLAAMLRERTLPIAGGALDETLIPSSVQALIAARIDALPAEPKRVLMEASVVGKTFWSGAIATVGKHEDLEGSLAELARREFCRPVHPSTMQGDSEFVFWHALVRDVAYAELTRAERATMHAATARWIADRTAGAMGEDAEIVVHHLDAALEFAPSAPELDTEPLAALLSDALIAAGVAAMRTNVPRAIPYLERTTSRWDPQDPREVEVLLLLGRAYCVAGHLAEAVPLLERLIERSFDAGDFDEAVRATIELSDALFIMGDELRADSLVEDMRGRLGTEPSAALSQLFAYEASNLGVVLRKYEAATRLAQRSIAMAADVGIDAPLLALVTRGLAQLGMGDLDGEADARGAIDGFLREGNLTQGLDAMYNLASLVSDERPAAGLSLFDELIDLAERLGAMAAMWGARAGRLIVLSQLGRYDDVLAEADPILAWAAEAQDRFTRLQVLASIAQVDIVRYEERVDPHELVALSEQMTGAGTLKIAARLAFKRGDLEFARSLVLESVNGRVIGSLAAWIPLCLELGLPDLAQELLVRDVKPGLSGEAFRAVGRAALAESSGEFRGAADGYAEAAEAYEVQGCPFAQALVLQGLGRSMLRLGETADGMARLIEARALYMEMKATGRVAEIDELLATISEGGSA